MMAATTVFIYLSLRSKPLEILDLNGIVGLLLQRADGAWSAAALKLNLLPLCSKPLEIIGSCQHCFAPVTAGRDTWAVATLNCKEWALSALIQKEKFSISVIHSRNC
jgi:hypothetical protein